MGKGDMRTRRGKIIKGTFGNKRPRLRNSPKAVKAAATKPAAVKKK